VRQPIPKYLEQLDRSRRRPTHLLLDDPKQLANFIVLVDEDLPLTKQSLAGAIKPLQEDHDRRIVGIRVELWISSAKGSAFVP